MGKGLKVYNTKPRMKLIPLAITGLILVTIATGCVQKMDCSIETPHAHKYIDNNGLVKYEESEYEYDGAFNGFKWTNVTVSLTNEIKLEDKFDLLAIIENREVLSRLMMANRDYIEFEYEYEWLEEIRHYKLDGKGNMVYDYSTYETRTDYRYTTDSNHSDLTGKARNVSYMYKAYRIVRDTKGNAKVQASELTDNIFNVMALYPYFESHDYCVTVNSDKYTLERDKTYSK